MENRKSLKTIIVLLIFLITTLAISSSCQANQWVYFHDEEIRGYVVEADTNKPIEGAIVVSIWELLQIPGHGFGGYAKVIEAKTDKDGNFIIAAWKTFKPLTADSVMHDLAPKIVIYKSGYKVYASHKKAREGFPEYYLLLTPEEMKKAKEANSINPAKLERIYENKDKLKNIDDTETELSIGSLHFKGIKLEIMKVLNEEEMSLKENRIQRRSIAY